MEKIFSSIADSGEIATATGTAVGARASLVAFDTTSRDSNLEFIDWAEALVCGYGARTRRTFDDDRRKANPVAVFGPEVAGGVLPSRHTDTVPVDDQTLPRDLGGSVPFGAEAGHFQQAGIPTVACGPGSITEAYQPDERIARDEISAAIRFLDEMASWASQ